MEIEISTISSYPQSTSQAARTIHQVSAPILLYRSITIQNGHHPDRGKHYQGNQWGYSRIDLLRLSLGQQQSMPAAQLVARPVNVTGGVIHELIDFFCRLVTKIR